MIKTLGIADNGRYFIQKDESGKQEPFFWLADTAWYLFEKLNLSEIEEYLQDRREKHFNVLQVVIANVACQDDVPGMPFEWEDCYRTVSNGDFGQIEEDSPYWNKIDTVIEMAAKYDMYLALLPVWGSMVKLGYLNTDNVTRYARFLIQRYGTKKNVIWVLGGDVRGDVGYDVWNLFGNALRKSCPEQLISFHPFGRTSSAMWFHEQEWLDFNMFQSGHRRYDQASLNSWDDNGKSEEFFGEDNWKYVQRELSRDNCKPVLDGEPSYDGIPQGLHDTSQPYWNAEDARRYAYWSVFQGACGHTYGHSAIMQFYRKIDKKGAYGVKEYWNQALHAESSQQMKYLYELMTKVDYIQGRYWEELLADGQKEKYNRIIPFAGKDYILIYDYSGRNICINIDKAGFEISSVQWFDPANGSYLEDTVECNDISHNGIVEFQPPFKKSGGHDWVLILK